MTHKLICFILGLSCMLSAAAQSTINDLLKPPITELPTIQKSILPADSIRLLDSLIRDSGPDFRGVVVIQGHKILLEKYYNTYWRSTIHDIRSAGKSITALLLGIAIDQGLLVDINQSVYELLKPSVEMEVPKHYQSVTIKHLLMMSSGLDADSNDPQSEGHSANWVAQNGWLAHALSIDSVFEPGTQWVYNDLCALLVGLIIEQKSGMKLADFANTFLFEPLGIKEFYWFSGADGHTAPMGNLYISTLDFAKIGLVVLNRGRYLDRQIVSASWIDEMTSDHVEVTPNPFTKTYGYFWYNSFLELNGQRLDFKVASGMGGNHLYIVPELDLVIGLTSSAYGLGRGHFRSYYIFQFIVTLLTAN